MKRETRIVSIHNTPMVIFESPECISDDIVKYNDFWEFEIFNKSTKVSLQKAYRTRSKYYDIINKELLIFDIESRTSDGSKSIILKSRPGDDKFFQENTNNVYLGKLDMFNEGEGNMHKNYNYSIPQNRQNLDDITKVSAKLVLPNLNFNLYSL